MRQNELNSLLTSIMEDQEISTKGKVILSLLIVNEDKRLSAIDLQSYLKEGVSAIAATIKELKQLNLISSQVLRERNKITKHYFLVYFSRWETLPV